MTIPDPLPRLPHPRRRRRLSQRHRDVSLDDLAPGESRHQDRLLLGQLQGRARRHRPGQDPAPLPARRRHRCRRPRRRIHRSEVQGRRRGAGHRLWPERDPRRWLRRIRAPRSAMGDPAAGRPGPAREHDPRHRRIHRGAGAVPHARQPADAGARSARRHRRHRRRGFAGRRHLQPRRFRGARDQRQARTRRLSELDRRHARCSVAMPWRPRGRWSRPASAVASTTSVARCSPACWRRPRLMATSPAPDSPRRMRSTPP